MEDNRIKREECQTICYNYEFYTVDGIIIVQKTD